jgi:imidazolonepropionase-like amidohydrolase
MNQTACRAFGSALACCLSITLCFDSRLALAQPSEPPDKIYVGGKVVTMTGPTAVAEAVATRGERIVAVGAEVAVRAMAGPGTKVVDLSGKALLPGFYAAHDHFPSWGRVSLYQVDLNSPPIGAIRTIEELSVPAEISRRLGVEASAVFDGSSHRGQT